MFRESLCVLAVRLQTLHVAAVCCLLMFPCGIYIYVYYAFMALTISEAQLEFLQCVEYKRQI